MRFIRPNITFIQKTDKPLKTIEAAGRTCYKSENNMTKNSAKKFVRMLISRGHEAMLEHASLSYRIVCDRGVSHELVRHRLFSFAQESTRYCDYNKGEIEFIIPCWFGDDSVADGEVLTPTDIYNMCRQERFLEESMFCKCLEFAEQTYKTLREAGVSPQAARYVLPNGLKTEVVVTGNLRQWRNFFKLRLDKAAHPQMREIANLLIKDAVKQIPTVFDDIYSEV